MDDKSLPRDSGEGPTDVLPELEGVGSASRLLQFILGQMPEVIFLRDQNLRHVAGNKAFFESFPLKDRDQLLHFPAAYLSPAPIEGLKAKDRKALARGLEAPMPTTPLGPGQGERVLIVEDEEFLLEQIDELLKELGYITQTAPSGTDAVEVLRGGAEFDLIITDMVMPGGIGRYELARIARQCLPQVPIIYMSGYTGFTDKEMGEVVAPFLSKPSSPAMMSRQIKAVLEGQDG